MNPIPKPIANRWRQMWHPDADDERPWWRWTPLPVRCDGAMLPPSEGWVTPAEGIAAYDREHPLPAPPPMPGQVLAWTNDNVYWPGRSAELAVVSVKPHDQLSDRGHETGLVVEFGDGEQMTVWPPTGAVLVCGPTPWGRDVPWVPGEVNNG